MCVSVICFLWLLIAGGIRCSPSAHDTVRMYTRHENSALESSYTETKSCKSRLACAVSCTNVEQCCGFVHQSHGCTLYLKTVGDTCSLVDADCSLIYLKAMDEEIPETTSTTESDDETTSDMTTTDSKRSLTY